MSVTRARTFFNAVLHSAAAAAAVLGPFGPPPPPSLPYAFDVDDGEENTKEKE